MRIRLEVQQRFERAVLDVAKRLDDETRGRASEVAEVARTVPGPEAGNGPNAQKPGSFWRVPTRCAMACINVSPKTVRFGPIKNRACVHRTALGGPR